jgi:hypothetical protein
MANKFIFKVQDSNFVITDDLDITIEKLRHLREELRFDVLNSEYIFKLKDTGVTVGLPNRYPFSDIIDDRTGLKFPTENDLKEFLSESLGFFFNPNAGVIIPDLTTQNENETVSLLKELLIEARITNEYFKIITNEEVTIKDIKQL